MDSLGTLTRSTQKKEISTQKNYDNNLQKKYFIRKNVLHFFERTGYMTHLHDPPKKEKVLTKKFLCLFSPKDNFSNEKNFHAFLKELIT